MGTLFSFHSIPAFYQNWQTSVAPEVIFTNSVNERAMASFFASTLSLNSLHLKTSLGPLPPPLAFYLSHFLPLRDLSHSQGIPSVGNTPWLAATQEAFDSCWSVPSFGKLTNSVGTMLVERRYSRASNQSSTES